MSSQPTSHVIVIGAGPAGLTAAWQAAACGMRCTLFERAARAGGMARTEVYGDYRFDIGPHRFFAKSDDVNRLWHLWLGDDFKTVARLTRIHYNGKYFHYPLRVKNALVGLGLAESLRIGGSFVASRLFPYPEEENFEQWVSNRFGKRLYEIFFKAYTEKIWGIPTTEIRADWAAQRIKGLSLAAALRDAVLPNSNHGQVKSLINQFEYPVLGAGYMWETVAHKLIKRGHGVHFNHEVVRIKHDGRRVSGLVVRHGDSLQEYTGDDVVSSMPLPTLIARLDPPPPPEILAAAQGLRYRAHIVVFLIIKQRDIFPDNWLYIHDTQVRVCRITNFKNWSPRMTPDDATSGLGLEYFCDTDDSIWQASDAALIEMARDELVALGLTDASLVIDGVVVRTPKAYPVYDATYAAFLKTLKAYLSPFENLQTIGRNGLHKYNNQDHAMLTGLLAVKNILGESHDLWEVNTERSYHEEVRLAPDADARRKI